MSIEPTLPKFYRIDSFLVSDFILFAMNRIKWCLKEANLLPEDSPERELLLAEADTLFGMFYYLKTSYRTPRKSSRHD